MGALPPDEDDLQVASYVGIGVRCGLSVKEALQVPVGLLLDLWEIYQRANGLKKPEVKIPGAEA